MQMQEKERERSIFNSFYPCPIVKVTQCSQLSREIESQLEFLLEQNIIRLVDLNWYDDETSKRFLTHVKHDFTSNNI